MSLGIIGALVGLAIGLGFFAFSRELGRRVDLDETRRALRVSALIQIIILPVAGYFVLPAIIGD